LRGGYHGEFPNEVLEKKRAKVCIVHREERREKGGKYPTSVGLFISNSGIKGEGGEEKHRNAGEGEKEGGGC